MSEIKYSITVPVYNEKNDIMKFLESFELNKRKDCECVIVDDSIDETPDIIKGYIKDKYGYRYILNKKKGRCEARNLAIKLSEGVYVFIWNADVLVPNNFFNKIDKYYDEKVDIIGFKNEIIEGTKFENYLKLFNEIKYYNFFYEKKLSENKISSTEGFMVKRELAIDAYPENTFNPLVAGDDFIFARVLEKRKVDYVFKIDFSIIIRHYMPDNFKEFYRNREGRGYGTPQMSYYFSKKKIYKIFIYSNLKFIYSILKLFLIPLSFKIFKEKSQYLFVYKRLNYIDFFIINFIERIAIYIGEMKSIAKIIKEHKINKNEIKYFG